MSRKINPKITQKFLENIKSQKSVLKLINGIKIKTCKNVYPPESRFSRASKSLNIIFGNLKGKTVLDIGTGTGIQAIQAVKKGAKKVVACDISKFAVNCAKNNVHLNKLENKISVLKSDLFEKVPKEKFDVIISNLPIVDYPIKDIVAMSLYDHNFNIHKRLFAQAGYYLKRNGFLISCHAGLQGVESFDKLETLFKKNNFKISRIISFTGLGYNWKYYKLKLK